MRMKTQQDRLKSSFDKNEEAKNLIKVEKM